MKIQIRLHFSAKYLNHLRKLIPKSITNVLTPSTINKLDVNDQFSQQTNNKYFKIVSEINSLKNFLIAKIEKNVSVPGCTHSFSGCAST